MLALRNSLFLLIFLVPLVASAEITQASLPEGTLWYLHANLKQMRESESGQHLHKWLDGQIFMEIHEDIGIDINSETDAVTAFSDREQGTVILVEGNISKDTQDKLLAIAAAKGRFAMLEHKDKIFYHVQSSKSSGEHEDEQGPDHEDDLLDGLEHNAYFSFAAKNRLIVTSDENQMQAMLDNGGKITGSRSHEGALFVLTADRTFVQAGLRTDRLADDDDGWRSNIIRNTEQAALLISGRDNLLAVQAQLVSSDAKMAESIGGIANGLISLQAFNSDLDPRIRTLIQNTKIEVTDNVLSVNTVIEPGLVTTMLSD